MITDELHLLAHSQQEADQLQEKRNRLQMELEQTSIFLQLADMDKVLAQLKSEAGVFEMKIRKLAFDGVIINRDETPPGCMITRNGDGLPVVRINKNLTEFL